MIIRKKNYKRLVKWLCYLLLLLVCCGIQSSPGMFSFFGIKPMMLVSVVVSVALFESEVASATLGLLAGFIWDLSAGKLFGFFGMALMVCCILITLLSMYYIKVNLTNALALCLGVSIICGLWDYLFYYFIWGYSGSSIYLLQYFLMAVYTTVLAIPVYLLVRWFVDLFHPVVRA